VSASHSWSSEDEYSVKVKAQCEGGVWSSWSSPHVISIGDSDYHWLNIEAYAWDFYDYDEVYPDIYIQENQPYFDDYFGTLPVSVHVSSATYYIEVDEYVWSDYFQQECRVYCIYAEEQGPWYFQNYADIEVDEDTWVTVVYTIY
jgi:hypothetical protein